MKKKLLFSSITLLSCLAILFGALFILPKVAHAAPMHQNAAKASAPTISVSPTSLNSGSTNCTHLGTINNQTYASCLVTITMHGSAPTIGINFTSSFSANSCYGSCVPYYNLAVLPSAGNLYSGSNTVAIIVPDEIAHQVIYADFFFSGPANKVKVHFFGANTCC